LQSLAGTSQACDRDTEQQPRGGAKSVGAVTETAVGGVAQRQAPIWKTIARPRVLRIARRRPRPIIRPRGTVSCCGCREHVHIAANPGAIPLLFLLRGLGVWLVGVWPAPNIRTSMTTPAQWSWGGTTSLPSEEGGEFGPWQPFAIRAARPSDEAGRNARAQDGDGGPRRMRRVRGRMIPRRTHRHGFEVFPARQPASACELEGRRATRRGISPAAIPIRMEVLARGRARVSPPTVVRGAPAPR